MKSTRQIVAWIAAILMLFNLLSIPAMAEAPEKEAEGLGEVVGISESISILDLLGDQLAPVAEKQSVYLFCLGDIVVSEQTVCAGDILVEPDLSEWTDGQAEGWYVEDDDECPLVFTDGEYMVTQADLLDAEVHVYARMAKPEVTEEVMEEQPGIESAVVSVEDSNAFTASDNAPEAIAGMDTEEAADEAGEPEESDAFDESDENIQGGEAEAAEEENEALTGDEGEESDLIATSVQLQETQPLGSDETTEPEEKETAADAEETEEADKADAETELTADQADDGLAVEDSQKVSDEGEDVKEPLETEGNEDEVIDAKDDETEESVFTGDEEAADDSADGDKAAETDELETSQPDETNEDRESQEAESSEASEAADISEINETADGPEDPEGNEGHEDAEGENLEAKGDDEEDADANLPEVVEAVWFEQSLEASCSDGALLTVSGVLPEHAVLSMEEKSSAGTKDAMNLYALDLAILNEAGEEIQPEAGPFEITMTGGKIQDALEAGRSLKVTHTTEDGRVEVLDELEIEEDTLRFAAGNFNEFLIDAIWDLADWTHTEKTNSREAGDIAVTLEGSMTRDAQADVEAVSPSLGDDTLVCAVSLSLDNCGNLMRTFGWNSTVKVTLQGEAIEKAVLRGAELIVSAMNDEDERIPYDADDITVDGDTVSFDISGSSTYVVTADESLEEKTAASLDGTVAVTGRVPKNSDLSVKTEAAKAENGLTAVEIVLLNYGSEIQTEEALTVSVSGEQILEAVQAGGKIAAVQYTDEGTATLEAEMTSENSVTFTAEKTGNYEIVAELKTEATEDEDLTEDKTSDGTDEPEEADNRSVSVTTSRGTHVLQGETILLTAEMEGFDDTDEVQIIWEVNEGNGWTEIGSGESYSYTADDESIAWDFRVRVLYRVNKAEK